MVLADKVKQAEALRGRRHGAFKINLHIQKQLAVSSLLSGELAVQQFREGGVADLEGEKKTTVTRIFNESDEGQLFQRIRAQQLDFRKQHALYQHDRLAAVTDDFAEEHVASVLQIANNARGVINDGTSGGLAGVFYRTTLVGG